MTSSVKSTFKTIFIKLPLLDLGWPQVHLSLLPLVTQLAVFFFSLLNCKIVNILFLLQVRLGEMFIPYMQLSLRVHKRIEAAEFPVP